MSDMNGQPVFKNFEEEIASLPAGQEYEIRPWLLLYVTANECETRCKEQIDYLQQLHIALGKNIQRVRRYYLHASDQPIPTDIAEYFRAGFPSMGIAYSNAEALEQNMQAAGVDMTLSSQSYIVLVDPVGNVMMYYTDENTAEDIMTDLETLLKYSSLG
jgi:cytochrome oxidase Cu insertion factor (SCO1/SenC/PrrC family)